MLKWYKILLIQSKSKRNTKEIQKNKTIIDKMLHLWYYTLQIRGEVLWKKYYV